MEQNHKTHKNIGEQVKNEKWEKYLVKVTEKSPNYFDGFYILDTSTK